MTWVEMCTGLPRRMNSMKCFTNNLHTLSVFNVFFLKPWTIQCAYAKNAVQFGRLCCTHITPLLQPMSPGCHPLLVHSKSSAGIGPRSASSGAGSLAAVVCKGIAICHAGDTDSHIYHCQEPLPSSKRDMHDDTVCDNLWYGYNGARHFN